MLYSALCKQFLFYFVPSVSPLFNFTPYFGSACCSFEYVPCLKVATWFILVVLFSENLCNGKFHLHLRDMFAPQVVRYVDLMESSIAQSIHRGFEKERWESQG